MTIHELIAKGGFGFRLSRYYTHRGSLGNGYIDAKYYYECFLTKANGFGSYINIVGKPDIDAIDWIEQDSVGDKLCRLVMGD